MLQQDPATVTPTTTTTVSATAPALTLADLYPKNTGHLREALDLATPFLKNMGHRALVVWTKAIVLLV